MTLPLLALGLATAAPAAGQDITPLAEARLRYEQVDQDGFAPQAEALILRLRGGVEAKAGPLSALVEGQGNLAIVNHYDDGLSGPANRPLVADPESASLYRAQLSVTLPVASITAGRQRITLDDERFIGNVGFRQNAQTFDAIRAQAQPLPGLKADVTYAWSVRTIWGTDGTDGTGARQQAVGGDNIFANLGAATPIGTLTGFGYWIDQDEAVVQGYRLSSKTIGARLSGKRQLGTAGLAWQASYARQSDYHRNPQDYAADYWLADLSVDFGGPNVGIGYEVLGADDGRALTSFQTPLGTNFKFQGWADRLLTTPPDGVRDLYARAGWNWATIGLVRKVAVQAAWHRFESDRLVRHYGNELNLMAGGTIGPIAAAIRFADYRADSFAADTTKFWLQLDWTI